ncbi:MAG: MarR family winged helix-turn-helix transcriptional regulator [Bacteroidota bacterium]
MKKTLGAAIGKTHKMMFKSINRRFKEAGLDLHAEHFIVLIYLWEQDGQNQQWLGEEAGKDKTSVTRAINGLEKRNMVLRVPDKQDKRHNLIYLTQLGKDLKEVIMPIMSGIIQKALTDIEEGELQTCMKVLSKVYDNLHSEI